MCVLVCTTGELIVPEGAAAFRSDCPLLGKPMLHSTLVGDCALLGLSVRLRKHCAVPSRRRRAQAEEAIWKRRRQRQAIGNGSALPSSSQMSHHSASRIHSVGWSELCTGFTTGKGQASQPDSKARGEGFSHPKWGNGKIAGRGGKTLFAVQTGIISPILCNLHFRQYPARTCYGFPKVRVKLQNCAQSTPHPLVHQSGHWRSNAMQMCARSPKCLHLCILLSIKHKCA